MSLLAPTDGTTVVVPMVVNWRRTYLANGTIRYPPVIRQAILACVKRTG